MDFIRAASDYYSPGSRSDIIRLIDQTDLSGPEQMKKLFNGPHPYAFITILCWAPTFVLSHMAAPYFSPASMGALRYVLAAVILAIILAARKIPLPKAKDMPALALAAVLGFSMYMIVFNKGTSMVTAATSSVVIAMVPVFTGILASILFRERLKKLQWAAMALQFAGVLILVLTGNSFSFNKGVLWLLLCVVMLGSYNIIQRKFTKEYPAFTVSAVSIIFGGIELLWAMPQGMREFSAAPGIMRFYVVFMGIFASALAYVTWTTAFSKAEKTSEVANYMFITPFFATLLGFVLNHEIPGMSTVIGGLMILSGAVLFNKK